MKSGFCDLFGILSNATKIYTSSTPSYNKIQNKYNLDHDHFAIRSFKGYGGINLVKDKYRLSKNSEYLKGGTLEIPENHTKAEWLFTNNKTLRVLSPRIFISEIDETKLSPLSQEIIKRCFSPLCTSNKCSFKDYKTIYSDSEYAAWTLINGSIINHMALNVPDHLSLEEFIQIINNDNNFVINNSNGLIKTSTDGMLQQSSIMSDKTSYDFTDETISELPGCFVEFVKRHKYPNGSIREGFDANNALHIFSSTKNIDDRT